MARQGRVDRRPELVHRPPVLLEGDGRDCADAWVALERLHEPLEEVGPTEGVVVEDDDDLAGAGRDASVADRREAAVLIPLEESNVREPLAQRRRDAVSRVVADVGNVRHGLPAQVLEAALRQLPPPIGRDDDVDRGRRLEPPRRDDPSEELLRPRLFGSVKICRRALLEDHGRRRGSRPGRRGRARSPSRASRPPSSSRPRRARGRREDLGRRAPGRARSSPRRGGAASASSPARGGSRPAAAGRPTAGRGNRRAGRRGRSGRAARSPPPRPGSRGRRAPSAAPRVTFESTLMCGKRLNAWKTIPIPRRTLFTSTPGAVISSPSTTMRPSSIGSSRLTQRSSVDFPEPEAPIRQTTSCSSTSRSIPRSTSALPNDLWRLSIRIRSGAGPRQLPARDRSPDARGAAPPVARDEPVRDRANGIVIATKSSAATTYGVKLNVAAWSICVCRNASTTPMNADERRVLLESDEVVQQRRDHPADRLGTMT